MYGRPVRNSPSTAITTVPPARIALRPAVVTASTTASWRSLPSAHRSAEARQDEQRVVDADADADQARIGGGPVGDVHAFVSSITKPPDVMPRPTIAIDSGRPAATTDPKAISSTIAAPRKPTPSGAGRGLRRIDRVAAELDRQRRSCCCARPPRSAFRRPPSRTPSRESSSAATSRRSCRPWRSASAPRRRCGRRACRVRQRMRRAAAWRPRCRLRLASFQTT